MMKIHHLNCGTIRLPSAPMVCHVLLVEYADRLVLVDTGYGLADIADPRGRVGLGRFIVRPRLDPAETAIRQVERLGFKADDVLHIFMTHLDVDHAGGLSDFPAATVHVTADEAQGAIHNPGRAESWRYNRGQWTGLRPFQEHPRGSGTWRGFGGTTSLDSVAPGLVLIPLPGHTRGHAGYALETDLGWLLHAGDAFYHEGAISGGARPPVAARVLERVVAFDHGLVVRTQRRLSDLYSRADPNLTIVCTHDPALRAARIPT